MDSCLRDIRIPEKYNYCLRDYNDYLLTSILEFLNKTREEDCGSRENFYNKLGYTIDQADVDNELSAVFVNTTFVHYFLKVYNDLKERIKNQKTVVKIGLNFAYKTAFDFESRVQVY